MKREELTKLGLEEETIEKIMKMYNGDVERNKAELTAKDQEVEVLKTQLTETTEKLNKFDGVDVEKLKTAANEWETKYNTEMAEIKKNSAIELAITKAGARNAAALKALLNLNDVKYDDGKLIGLDEQINTVKKTDTYLFSDDVPAVTTGLEHNGTPPIENDGLEEAFLKINPDLASEI